MSELGRYTATTQYDIGGRRAHTHTHTHTHTYAMVCSFRAVAAYDKDSGVVESSLDSHGADTSVAMILKTKVSRFVAEISLS